MTDSKYSDSDKYQEEIAEQYKQRIPMFSHAQVVLILKQLGFDDVEEHSVEEAVVGNVNATYLTPHLVIKINTNKGKQCYWANKVVCDLLPDTMPVVRVLTYDFFNKTDYEVLIMKRSSGSLLLHDVFNLTQEEQLAIFKQVLDVVIKLSEIKFNSFGFINADEHFTSHGEFLADDFKKHIAIIRKEKLCTENDTNKVEKYFFDNIGIFFDDKTPVFIHTDLHMGNILHEGNRVTAILDFDSALQAPKWVVLRSLLGVIADPSQYVEGTEDFVKFKGKDFYHFLPMLQHELSDVFSDPKLLRKLNIRSVAEGIKWISGNWSTDWNKEMMKNLIERELAISENALHNSYYGRIFAHLEK